MRMLLIIPQNFISNSLKLFKPVINQSSSSISYPVNIQLLVKQYSVLIGNKLVNHEKQNLNEVHEFYSTAFGVDKYDNNWKKQWFGAGIFYEGSEEVEVDVLKKLEKRKVLSNVEKAGLLSKAEELGFTLSSIEKLGLFSKAEELGLLSLLEKAASFSPSALASAALPVFVAAIVAVVLIPDDSAGLVAVQVVVAGALTVGAAGLVVGSVVLDGLQEAD
ncbi:hypothetical protein C3L33_00802, partial [Rhododendron williamsianum]